MNQMTAPGNAAHPDLHIAETDWISAVRSLQLAVEPVLATATVIRTVHVRIDPKESHERK